MPRYQDPKEADRIMREAGAIPLEPYLGSQVKWKCRCMKCKEIIYPTFAPIKNAGVSPCRTCAANEMGARRRAKSESQNIKILKKANFIPLEPFPGSNKPWRVWILKGFTDSYQRARRHVWIWSEWLNYANKWRKGFSLQGSN